MLTFADLDTFRDRYDSLAFPEFREWCQRIAETWPEQAYWDAEAVAVFLNHFDAQEVVEIGGWDGALARQEGARRWINLEVTEVPQVCIGEWYELHVLEDWPWTWTEWGDAVVLSHVIEHMSEDHLRKLAAAIDKPVFVDAPLYENLWTNWKHSTTGHVLGLSMREVDEIFVENGFSVVHRDHGRVNAFPSQIRWYA